MKDPRTLAEDFVRQVEGHLGPRLQAATLFGSAARGEWIQGLSDVNVLVLLDEITLDVLEQAAPAARKAVAAGVVPLLMERDEWASAEDVFAIELADLRDASLPLFGGDPTADLVIDTASLRLQAERELRAKLVHLHGEMLVSARDPKRLGALLVRALPSFTTYLRAALRLTGGPVPPTSEPVILHGCTLIGADPDAFLRVLQARQAGGGLAVKAGDPLADQFNAAAKRLTAYIDDFGR